MVALTSIVLIATLSLARWSFEQGFADFINGLERERLGRIAEQAIVQYELAGNSWQGIEKQTSLLARSTNRLSPRGPRRAPPPRPKFTQTPPSSLEQRGNVQQGSDVKAPLPLTHLISLEGDVLLSSTSATLTDRGRLVHEPSDRPRRPQPKRQTNPNIQISEHKDTLLKNSNSNSEQINKGIEIEIPIVFEGDTIALLRSYTPAPLSNSLASKFEQQQLNASYIIGLVSLAFAAAVAFFIATMFVKPIKLLSAGVSQLTEGKYHLKLPTTGKDELAQLMQDTESLANTLNQARSQKNRWFADISHELRTPLTILVGEIEAIRAGIRKFDTKQLNSIEQEVSLLHRLVDDLYQLSLSDVGALKYEFKLTNITEMVSSSVASFRESLAEKQIELKTNILPNIHHLIDPQRFEQLLNNLLSNSLKYTDAGGQLHLTLEQHKTVINLSIEDSYPSVPKEECDELFKTLYQRNTSRNRSNSGAGLGLAICKNIAESHHASISASPSELGGLKVLVSLKKENVTK